MQIVPTAGYVHFTVYVLRRIWTNDKEVYTVKKVDEVVRQLHLVTQDQFSLVSKQVYGVPEDNFTINIELFWQTLTNAELLRQNWIVSKATSPGSKPSSSVLHSDTLPLRHTLFLI